MKLWRRGRIWYLRDWQGGRWRMLSLRTDEAELAKALLREHKVRKMQDHFGLLRQQKRTSLSDFLVQYAEYRSRAKSATFRNFEMAKMRKFEDFCRRKSLHYLEAIDPPDIESWKAERSSEVSKATLAGDRNWLHHLFATAVSWGFLSGNPVDKVERVRYQQREKTIINDQELERLLATARKRMPYMGSVVLLARYTGLRRGELERLSDADLDLERAQIIVRGQTKSYFNRRVPIAPQILAMLRRSKRQKGRVLRFPGLPHFSADHLTHQFSKLAKRAKVKGVTLHSLRHTFITRSLLSGVAPAVVKRVAGHRYLTTTEGYLHTSDEHAKEAYERAWKSE